MEAMTWKINGVSLKDAGYASVGLDDYWQACGTGVNGSFHNASGYPLVNLELFPDMKAMNAYCHSLGLKSGWYGNNCICRENYLTNETDILNHYKGDV